MIIDKIENYKLYNNINSKLSKAFAYINATNLLEIPTGEYEIDGDDVFAIVMEYQTKDKSQKKLEGHHKYIDFQYLISGSELIGVTTLTNQIAIEINKDKDCDFYKSDFNLVNFDAEMFMIFFPDDLHMPGVSANQVSTVKKVVIKIKI